MQSIFLNAVFNILDVRTIQIFKERMVKKPFKKIAVLVIHSTFSKWWSQAGSNRRPPACKAGALPAELWPLG
jgi:hypothetical protein